MKILYIDVDVLCNELRDYDWVAYVSALRIVDTRSNATMETAVHNSYDFGKTAVFTQNNNGMHH